MLGTAALIAALFGILAAAVWSAVRTWISAQGAPIPPVGYVAMAIGVTFSLLVGFALMTLVFYSSRYGYDERASQEFHTGDDRSHIACRFAPAVATATVASEQTRVSKGISRCAAPKAPSTTLICSEKG